MAKVPCTFLIVAGMLCYVQAQTFLIRKKFINGNLEFTWTKISEIRHNVIVIIKDGRSALVRTTDDKYTVEDVWKYKSVKIFVRESFDDYNSMYTVTRIDALEGESKNLAWTADFFPRSGLYYIYHFDEGTSNTVMRIMNSGPTTSKPLKYVYHTIPINSTNIILEVKNIELMDGGYYVGGTSETDARSGQGVILVVNGKPTKPQIIGNITTTENGDVTLTCSSNSTSRPLYYSKTVSLVYIWYKNDTVMSSETRVTLRIPRISKEERFDKYACRSKESIESERSIETRINVLYGPSSPIIRPPLPVNQILSVKDGDYIGPYHCSADCNPPCSIQWKYKLSNGTYRDAESYGGTLLKQRVFRNIISFRCVAKSTSGNKELQDINVYILYLSKPVLMMNGNRENNVNINEGDNLKISCSVDGRPTPTLNISRSSQEDTLKTRTSKSVEVLNQRVQCDDTDIYKCTASSMFGNNYTEVTLNVLCNMRIDAGTGFKSNYGSRSGPGVKVIVRVPIISNPRPSANSISWSGPMSPNIQNEIEGTDVIYKHWIISNIPIQDKRYFGKYTMIYNGQPMATITVKAEDIPKPPLNFTGYSYSSGYINLTWISDFNGGPEQFFILSRKAESGWKEVANITDPGEGGMGYYDPGHLNPGHEYWYQLESCNRINCSFRPVESKITVLECKSGYFLSGNNPSEHYRNSSDCWPCGNCRDNLPCNTTSGHCSEGCQINFQPPYCTELITPDQYNIPPTSTIVLAIICTVLLVTIAIIAGVAFRRRLKRRPESTPSQSENEANTPMNATEGQQQPEDTYDYPLNEYEKINVATNDHTYTTQQQQQPEDTYECPLNEYEKINVTTDDHTYTTSEQPQPEDSYECTLNEYEKISVATDGHTYDKVA